MKIEKIPVQYEERFIFEDGDIITSVSFNGYPWAAVRRDGEWTHTDDGNARMSDESVRGLIEDEIYQYIGQTKINVKARRREFHPA